MGDYHSKLPAVNRTGTLNDLKEQLHSLNMRMLLAMQAHDRQMEEDLQEQMTEVQRKIDQLCAGGAYRRGLQRQMLETE